MTKTESNLKQSANRKSNSSLWVIVGCVIVGLSIICGALVVSSGFKLPLSSISQQDDENQQEESAELSEFEFLKSQKMQSDLRSLKSAGDPGEFANWMDYYREMPFEELCKEYELYFPQRWHKLKKEWPK